MAKPVISRPEGSLDRPHCGRCGVEYDRAGCGYADYNPSIRLDYYHPHCTCWTLAPEPKETHDGP